MEEEGRGGVEEVGRGGVEDGEAVKQRKKVGGGRA